MMIVLIRCQLCEGLSFNPRVDKCNDCGWEGDCFICGFPLANPTQDCYCSDLCSGKAFDEIWADLMQDR